MYPAQPPLSFGSLAAAYAWLPVAVWVLDLERMSVAWANPAALSLWGAQTLEELRADVDRLAEQARTGRLAPEDLRGSTFTVTSAGKLAGLFVTPLVNHPEVGILGVHRIAPRPVVRDGEIVVRPMGNISTTFDHRVIDGARAAAFTLDVIGRLERGDA